MAMIDCSESPTATPSRLVTEYVSVFTASRNLTQRQRYFKYFILLFHGRNKLIITLKNPVLKLKLSFYLMKQGRKNMSFESDRKSCVQNLVLPIHCYMSLSKLLHFGELQFPCWSSDNTVTSACLAVMRNE